MTEELAYDPAKPPWDTRVEGTPDAFTADVSDKEIAYYRKQARDLATAPGHNQADPKQRFLAENIDAEHHHRVNLTWALQNKKPAHVVLAHRRALATALLYQGEFVQALNVVRQGKRSYPGCRDLIKQIAAWRRAVYCSDDERCDCVRYKATIPDFNRQNEPDAEIELPRRNVLGWVFSRKHGKVVEVWECRCGHLNANDKGPPSAQQERMQTNRLSLNPVADINLFKPTGG